MNDLLNQVAEYDNDKIVTHGQTPAGVDWNSAESQSLRFIQLSKALPETGAFTLNDLRCGYGALFDYTSPTDIFHFGKRHLSRNVALVHDYHFCESTVIVRKDT